MPTMHDVAKRAKVSLSTVSYAINGTRPISDETRERIFLAMEELGYRPNALARGLASRRSRILALLFSTPERGLGMTELEFVTSTVETATENGYHLVLWSAEMNGSDELQKLTQEGLADGVIVMEVHSDDDRVNLLRSNGFSFNMIGRCADTTGISFVDIDFEQTTQEVIGYLTGLGHTHIAFLNQSEAEFEAGYGPVVRTQMGFDKAMQAIGLNSLSRFCRPSPQAGYEAFNQLVAEDPHLTALISMNERAIPGVIQAIADRNWRIPEDFSLVVTVSSARFAEMMMPPLTAMEAPSARLGRLAVEHLIQQLETQERSTQHVLLPCRLVVRNSTGLCLRNRELTGE